MRGAYGRGELVLAGLLLVACKEPGAAGPAATTTEVSIPQGQSDGPSTGAKGAGEGTAVAGAERAANPATAGEARARPPSRNPAAPRVVAIGDVHGDFEATRKVLRLVGAIDERNAWVGGELVVVQTGDQLDRGDGEQEIVDLFTRLVVEAEAAGGAVHVLNGNHELMNAQGDLRYVTPGGFADFEDAIDPALKQTPVLKSAPAKARARLAAFLPGGPYARVLAQRNVAVIVGDTVFVHGGVTPRYAQSGLEDFNAATQAWLLGERTTPPPAVVDPEGPVWTRRYSQGVDEAACRDLAQSLAALQVKRMVVGHTVQQSGVTSACDGRVWRIDVGMAAHYGSARPQALEIRGDDVRVLAGG